MMPAAAARQAPMAKVMLMTLSEWMPTRADMTLSWAVARMALPMRVR